jgi:hypothetical protein
VTRQVRPAITPGTTISLLRAIFGRALEKLPSGGKAAHI